MGEVAQPACSCVWSVCLLINWTLGRRERNSHRAGCCWSSSAAATTTNGPDRVMGRPLDLLAPEKNHHASSQLRPPPAFWRRRRANV